MSVKDPAIELTSRLYCAWVFYLANLARLANVYVRTS